MPLALLAAFAVLAPQTPPPVAARAQGRIVDVLGEPVPAAVVWVTDAAGRERGRATSDGTGLFQLRAVREGPLELHVSAAGKVEWCTALAPLRAFAAAILLEDAGPLHGVVQDDAGAPIAGAHVVAWAANLELYGGRQWHADAVADARGEFAFAAAPLRPCSLRAWAPGRELATVEGVLAGRGTPVALKLKDGPQQPRVVRVDGMPAGVEVAVEVGIEGRGDGAAALPAPLRGAVVQRDGTAALWPLPLLHMVSVHADGFSSRPVACRAAAGSTEECRFSLSPLPPEVVAPHTTVHGRVVDALGRPLAGLEVVAGGSDQRAVASVTSGADGAFTVDVPVRVPVLCALGLAPGPFRIGDPRARAGEDGITWLAVRADPSQPVVLHSLPAAAIRGAVAAPFANVEVAEAQPRDVFVRRASATTDAGGRFEVRGLPGGDYRVFVHLSDQQLAFADVHVGEGGAADLGPLQVPPSGELTGVVRDNAGDPQAGVWICPVPAAETHLLPPGAYQGIGRSPLPVLTDRAGRYRMRGLAAGTWGIQCGVQSGFQGRRPRLPAESETVLAGRVATHDLTLAR